MCVCLWCAQERDRLIWQNLKRTAAALSAVQEENRALRHEVRALRGDAQYSDGSGDEPDYGPGDGEIEPAEALSDEAVSDASSSEDDGPGPRP